MEGRGGLPRETALLGDQATTLLWTKMKGSCLERTATRRYERIFFPCVFRSFLVVYLDRYGGDTMDLVEFFLDGRAKLTGSIQMNPNYHHRGATLARLYQVIAQQLNRIR